jgi:hypothetical protein
MFATIEVSPYVFVQGQVSQVLPCGRVAIKVREREYTGAPLRMERKG